ncbi:MAG: SgcJ/EcaC family oxidoreductase [Acidobacteriota bacterium]
MHVPRKVMLVILLSIMLIVSGMSSATQKDNVRAGIEGVNKQFSAAVAKGDAAAVAELYTDDGMVMPPNVDFVRGKAAIKGLFEGFIAAGIKSITLTTLEIVSFGDTAHEVGLYVLKGPDGTEIDKGKSLVIWKRVKGEWKLHRDIFNTSLPAPAR